MAEMEVDSEFGCGFMGGIFQRRSYWPRKTSVRSLPSTEHSKRQRSSSVESACKASNLANKSPPKLNEQSAKNSTLVHPKVSSTTSHKRVHGRRPSDAARSSTSSSTSSVQTKVPQSPDLGRERKLKREPTSNSSELTKMITDPQLLNESKALIRSTPSNAMILGHLGNLKQTGPGKLLGNNSPNSTVRTVDYLSRNLREKSFMPNNPKNGFGKLGGNVVMGNIVRKNSDEFGQLRGLVNRLDPEAFKSKGNEAYKQGRFDEALALYDRAIGLDSNKATYRCNKSAALIGLGRIMEAVFECKEAILIEPSYHRAHHRLANLYLRLGEAGKALHHYKHAGANANSDDIAKAQALQNHLSICTEARKLKEWNTLLKETKYAISSGADSAPQVYALHVEALLNLYRHEEAHATYQKGPNISIDSCTRLIGPATSAYIMMIEARVYLAAGRFEDAVAASQQAAKLDPSNKEVNIVVKRARAVKSARLSGNLLFKASKFSEAFVTYNEGLENDPYNAVLLCNRAACRSKLGQYEKAVEDCTTALNVRPSYSKARLRRADCNAKLERWEASVQDYEMLIRETPGDEEVGRALFEAQVQLKKQRGEDIKDLKFGSNLIFITSNERFRHFITSPGMSVVLFCNKSNHKQVLQVLEHVCKRFPSINFLKVEIEDHPYLANSEHVRSIPAFKIYKNGSRVKEIPGNDREMLESSVKLYSS
ncbi:TPR repeat-containing thioredoxin TTL1-like [Quercus lobata]|uniref:Thioredoxin domain-containing protein n=1 Tax=Quercus lobata TaxID=97700 RepID=A0A7N2N648_QUELO|nr:TPR repeat-containing thioredoxin TTL1-like [Quercus lobata]